MSGLAAGAQLGRSPRLALLAVALSGVLGTLIALAIASLAGPAAPVSAPARPFAVAVPAGWSELPAARLPGSPVAALRRDDGRATLTIRRTGAVHATGVRLVHDIGRQLRSRFPGFRPVSARFVAVRGGRAFVYTFVHGATVQTLALVSARGRAYAIDGVVAAGASDAARQLGAVVRSFGP